MDITNDINLLDKQVVIQIVTEMQKSEDLDRRKLAFRSWQGYSGNIRPFIEEELQRTRPKSWEGYTIPSISISKMIVDGVAKAYREQPIRRISDDDSKMKSERLEEIYKESEAHKQLPFLDTSVNLHKYSLLWMTYREQEQRYQCLTLQPHEFATIRNKDTGELTCVILNYGNQEITAGADTGDGVDDLISESQEDSSAQHRQYAMWTKDNFVVVEEEIDEVRTSQGTVLKKSITYKDIEGNPNNENFIGMIPFVWVSRELSFDNPTISPLFEQTVTANALMSEYLTASNIQGTGQLVFSYPERLENSFKRITTGLLTALKLPQSNQDGDSPTTAQYISPSPDLAGQRTAVMTYIKSVMKEHGFTMGDSMGADGESFTSGLDRAIANSNVDDIIKNNQEIYMEVEQSLFEIIKAWEIFLGNRFFKDDDDLSLSFKKPKIMLSDKETLENIEKRMTLGLISKRMAIQMLDPNLTDDEADELLEIFDKEKMDRASKMISNMTIPTQGNEENGEVDQDTESRPE